MIVLLIEKYNNLHTKVPFKRLNFPFTYASNQSIKVENVKGSILNMVKRKGCRHTLFTDKEVSQRLSHVEKYTNSVQISKILNG